MFASLQNELAPAMKKVLIVEPDLVSGMAYSRAFVVAGFDSDHATSGSRAMSALENTKTDLVIVNLSLRDGQALKLIRAIRSLSKSMTCPVIGFLRESNPDLIDNGLSEGAIDCVVVGKDGGKDLVALAQRTLHPAKQETLAPAIPKPLVAPPPPVVAAPPPVAATARAVPPKPEPMPAQAPPPKQADLPPPERTVAPPRVVPRMSASAYQNISELSRRLFGEQNQAARRAALLELHQAAQAFAPGDSAGGRPIDIGGRLLEGWLALIKDLCENPYNISSSNVRTIFQAVNSLEAVLQRSAAPAQDVKRDFKILAVDDEPGIRSLVKLTLATAQLESDNAKDGLEGLELSKQRKFDLFILDVDMPGLTGFELCKRLRASPGYKRTPVIFLTGSDTLESRIRSAGSGGDDFIGKPFLPKELAVKALIHLLLNQSESET